MPQKKGQYTASDLDAAPQGQAGQYSAADIGTGQSPAQPDIRDRIIHSMDPDLSGSHPIKNTLLGAGQGIANMVLHPIDSMTSNAYSGGSGYPGVSHTGYKPADEANANLLSQRSQSAQQQGQQLATDFKASPAHTIGKIAGPIIVAHGIGKIAPAVSEATGEGLKRGGANLIDRTAGSVTGDFSHGAQPGRAYLEGGGTPALTMRGLANKVAAVKNEAGAQLRPLYQAAGGEPIPPRAPIGALPAAPTVVPLGEAPAPIDVPGELLPAQPMSRSNIVGSGANPNYENPLRAEIGSIAAATPARSYRPNAFVTSATREAAPVPSGPSGPGVMITRDPAVANQFHPVSNEPYRVPTQFSGVKIPAESVRNAVTEPINRLRSLQEGPGGTGVSPSLNEYEDRLHPPINAAAQRGGFTPLELFDQIKKPISENTRWNDPAMFDLNSARQQATGAVGGLLTDAVPEAGPLNKIYQGTNNLAARADARANTGQMPLTSMARRGVETALGAGVGYATHHPLLGAIPLLADTVPGKTSLGYGAFQLGRSAPLIGDIGSRLAVPAATGAGRIKRVNDEEPDEESGKK